jgi:hypothetical protein
MKDTVLLIRKQASEAVKELINEHNEFPDDWNDDLEEDLLSYIRLRRECDMYLDIEMIGPRLHDRLLDYRYKKEVREGLRSYVENEG